MTEYTEDQVRSAAQVAYRSSMAGDNEDYVHSKSEAFVNRCHSYDQRGAGDNITQAAVKEIAFAALDSECTLRMYAVLDAYIR